MTEMDIKIIFIYFLTTEYSNCSTIEDIDKIANLIQTHKQVYGGDDLQQPTNHSKMVNSLEYPRGDKQKLAQISNIWCDYYECTARMLSKLTTSKRMPSVILTAYEGATIKLPCGLCVAPDELTKLVWKYSKSNTTTFNKLVEQNNMVHENGDLTIYHVIPELTGVYRCEIGRSVSGLVILQVVDDEEEYDVVKPSTSKGPYPTPSVIIGRDLTVFTLWSSWSECSSCGRVGRTRRYGMCYVKINHNNQSQKGKNDLSTFKGKNSDNFDQDTREMFEDFPAGIPCRSAHLPALIRDLAPVKQRRNEIMIAMCKVRCANSTDEIFQGGKQVPLPTRKIQFTVHGERTKIRCPGSVHRDMPVSWRIGTKPINPRTLDEDSNGRVHLNARDHIVFTEVSDSDTNLYSCWQGNRLAGTVKLVVWRGDHSLWNHQTLLVAILVATYVLLRYLDRVMYRKQRQIGTA